MKITIEPTVPYEGSNHYPCVSVSIPKDDLRIDEMMELVRAALLGAGFSESSVTSYLGE